jgi:head-tail adaptor
VGDLMLARGRLNRRVAVIDTRVGSVFDGHGEEIPGPPVEIVRYAEVKPVPGTERFMSAENAANAPTRFLFAYAVSVDVEKQLRYPAVGGKIYEILSVDEYGNRDGWDVLAITRAEVANA